ncbi:hypothetical protein [Rhizobium sp. CSW-27]|uniref:hypothetical protein n=1 Tax=Rhizobium sp. CSW-27 TaxID=2839985 RepID=UPI001C00923B|nr:hypothetical protein [Rhizobium sp. CSW-27]MBT9368975.1 hypothetical protein [Rhizobium sp. CSW-27]
MVIIDERLSKGLVRAEARTLKQTLQEHGHEVFVTLMEGIAPRFRTESRLRPDELAAVAEALHQKAGHAYSSLYADLVLTPPTRGRPNSGAYDMLHFWIRPIPVPGEAHHLMRLAVFTSNGNRKNVEMCAHDTVVGFFEHAAERLLQRCGTRREAIRAIGQRLVDTIILPSLALDSDTGALIDTDMHIPFADGLLIGRFIARTEEKLPGGYFRILNRKVTEGGLCSETKADFVIKTFIGPDTLNERQIWTAYEVNGWLERHRDAAQTIRRHLFHPGSHLCDNGYMAHDDYEALKADFQRMRERVFAPLQA